MAKIGRSRNFIGPVIPLRTESIILDLRARKRLFTKQDLENLTARITNVERAVEQEMNEAKEKMKRTHKTTEEAFLYFTEVSLATLEEMARWRCPEPVARRHRAMCDEMLAHIKADIIGTDETTLKRLGCPRVLARLHDKNEDEKETR